MSVLSDIANAFTGGIGSALDTQVQQAESTATTIGYAVAVWGAIVAIELGVLIYFTVRKR